MEATMATPTKRVLSLLRAALAPTGLDVVIPLTVESYNAFLENDTTAASDLTRFKLPLADAALGSDAPPLASHLLVLVGNSRALWEPFLRRVAEEIEREGRVLPDPVDRYVQQSVADAIAECQANGVVRPFKTYWTADMTEGKMILAQKMAVAARAVSRCPPSQLCLHPVFGPWLAFRCALAFPLEGIPEDDAEAVREPAECSHDEKMHTLLAAQMAEALGQMSKDKPFEIAPDAWKKWSLPRLTIAPSHPMMYPQEQLLYHYTKDLAFLAKVVVAKQNNLCTDYLREKPPAAAVEFRTLLQQVLNEYRAQFPEGIDAISLSGGLDTSILAEASAQPWVSEHGEGVFSLDKADKARPILSFKHAFTVQASADAPDAGYAQQIFQRLQSHSIQSQHILTRTLEELLVHATPVAKLLMTCDPMELRNSVVIYATLQEAARLGVRHIVTGDGADEIFCGYAFYQSLDEDAMLAYRDQILTVMNFTASTLARAFDIQVISPFLDNRVVEFARKLTKKDLVGERTPVPVEGPGVYYGKLVMRHAFPESFSQWRWKQPIEQGAGTTALRMGYFDNHYTKEEFEKAQREAMQTHGVYVRDNEHLFFFRAFLEAFAGDLGNVPKRRTLHSAQETLEKGFCPACGFELSHEAQDFCVTCGFWPTCISPTNDSKGYATQALEKLAIHKRQLLATED